MIKTVIKAQNGMVLAFDARGQQLPEYQGFYKDVKPCILKDAPASAVFTHWFGEAVEPIIITKQDW